MCLPKDPPNVRVSAAAASDHTTADGCKLMLAASAIVLSPWSRGLNILDEAVGAQDDMKLPAAVEAHEQFRAWAITQQSFVERCAQFRHRAEGRFVGHS